MKNTRNTPDTAVDLPFLGVYFPDGLTEPAIDVLLAEVDDELATDGRVMTTRLRCSLIEGRAAHRGHRRVVGEVLRALPLHLPVSGLVDGEAA